MDKASEVPSGPERDGILAEMNNQITSMQKHLQEAKRENEIGE
jgi:hypothetical protein